MALGTGSVARGSSWTNLLHEVAPALSPPQTNATLLLFAWRADPTNVVTRLQTNTPPAVASEDFHELATRMFAVLHADGVTTGPAADARQLDRAFARVWQGDSSLLREPWHGIAVLPSPAAYLPRSLRTRVRHVAFVADLKPETWHGQLHLVTDNEPAARQVAALVAGFRDLFGPWGERVPTEIQVVGHRVVIEGSVPADLACRAIQKGVQSGFFQRLGRQP
jgi:hypothetical protein